MKKLEISIWSNSKEIYSTKDTTLSLLQKRLNKNLDKLNDGNKIKLYNYSIFALALLDFKALESNILSFNIPTLHFMGLNLGYGFYFILALIIINALTNPILSIIKGKQGAIKKGGRNLDIVNGHIDVSKAGYTSKSKGMDFIYKIITSILLIISCLLILSIPMFIF